MKTTIGFIGTGMIGSALARLAINAGYKVVLSASRGPEALADFVRELGDNASATTVEDIANHADIIIASIPLGAYSTLPADKLAGKIVIDTMNYYPSARDGSFVDIDAGTITTSEMIQNHLSDSKVIKALHNLDFHHLYINARPENNPTRTTLPIAGNDHEAKQIVADFINRIGYNSVDIGTLTESWRIEPGTPIYVWPYVPNVPDDLNDAEAKQWYLEHSGEPLSTQQVEEMVEKTERHFPVGGLPSDLPNIHVALVAEVYKSRQS